MGRRDTAGSRILANRAPNRRRWSTQFLAEKLTTAIELGAANSRIRDVADVRTLTGLY